jgi:hypothetical protein
MSEQSKTTLSSNSKNVRQRHGTRRQAGVCETGASRLGGQSKGVSPEEKIIPRFPALFHDGKPVPSDLIGATIVQFGAPEETDGDELVIEYRPAGQSAVKRALILFSELGMWIDPKRSQCHPAYI